jgi:hypothetical protein
LKRALLPRQISHHIAHQHRKREVALVAAISFRPLFFLDTGSSGEFVAFGDRRQQCAFSGNLLVGLA